MHRGNVRVNCLAQEHNTMSRQDSNFGGKCTDREAGHVSTDYGITWTCHFVVRLKCETEMWDLQISSGVSRLGKYGEQSVCNMFFDRHLKIILKYFTVTVKISLWVHTVQPCVTGGWIKERWAGFNLDSLEGGGNQSADTCTCTE